MRLTSFYILIISCIISVISLESVEKTTPIFGKCIDKELRIILNIIAASQNGKKYPNPIEIKQEVENLMRMIKAYLAEEQISMNSSRRSRRFFFWPFRPWTFRLPTSVQGGLMGSVYGGYGPEGFTIGGGLGGGLQGHWQKYH